MTIEKLALILIPVMINITLTERMLFELLMNAMCFHYVKRKTHCLQEDYNKTSSNMKKIKLCKRK